MDAKFAGHAVNIVDITDATADKVGKTAFAVIEPQLADPTEATICTWFQDNKKGSGGGKPKP